MFAVIAMNEHSPSSLHSTAAPVPASDASVPNCCRAVAVAGRSHCRAAGDSRPRDGGVLSARTRSCLTGGSTLGTPDFPCTGGFEGGGGFERRVPAVRGTVVPTLFSSCGRFCFGGNGHQCGRLANHYEQKRMTRLVAAALMTGWLVKGVAIA